MRCTGGEGFAVRAEGHAPNKALDDGEWVVVQALTRGQVPKHHAADPELLPAFARLYLGEADELDGDGPGPAAAGAGAAGGEGLAVGTKATKGITLLDGKTDLRPNRSGGASTGRTWFRSNGWPSRRRQWQSKGDGTAAIQNR